MISTVDWGPEFAARHSAQFPDFGTPALVVGIAWLGLQHILRHGGSGYFPQRLVRPHIDAGELHAVPGASGFRLPAYMVYPTAHDPELLTPALTAMREVAGQGADHAKQGGARRSRQ